MSASPELNARKGIHYSPVRFPPLQDPGMTNTRCQAVCIEGGGGVTSLLGSMYK